MVLTTITSSVSSKGSIIVGNLMDNAIRGAVASDERRLSPDVLWKRNHEYPD